MGNIWSSGVNGRRRRESRRSHPPPPPVVPPQSEISVNRYVIPAATPYHSQDPNPNNTPHPYNQYPGYYVPPPAMPMPLPAFYDHGPHSNPHLQVDPAQAHANWVGGSYPCGPVMPPPAPHIEHQKAVTIRNDVNLKKETLRIEPDEENPDQFLVSFTFDATVAGRGLVRSGKIFCDYYWWKSGWAAYTFRNDNTITDVWIGTIISIIFFAKEGEDCNLTPMKENLIAPVTVHFQQGLGQKFQQPSGTGINFSIFEETDILKVGDMNIYPLVVKAEATAVNKNGTDGNAIAPTTNSQITQAVLGKEKGEYQVRVVKQILWVNGMKYELQEIYGIGNSVEGDLDGNDPGKECVICLSELRDTTILPCRHMCMCSGCAKVLRLQTTRCPICRQPVERLLEIKVNNGFEE